MDVKQFLNNANNNAVEHTTKMQAFYDQLKKLDQKTNTICFRFLSEKELETVERELMAEQLVILQRCRAAVVKEALQLGRNI